MLRHETDLIGNQIFIGHKIFGKATGAWLEPVAVARPEGWIEVDLADFPQEGRVFSLDPKITRKSNGYVALFTITANAKAEDRDTYITDRVDEAIEIAHFMEMASSDERRDVIMRSGIERGSQEDSSLIVPLDANRVAVPRMQRSGSTTWVLSHLEHADRLPAYARPDGDFDWVAIDGRRFLLPGQVPRDVVGFVNWESDLAFLQTVIKRINKIARLRPGTEEFVVNDRLSNRLHTMLRDGEIIGETAGANDAARDRLGEFLTKLDRETGAATAIAEALFRDPAVKNALTMLSEEEAEAIRLREVERIRPKIVSDVETGIADRLLKLEALSSEVADAQSALVSKSEELERVERLVEAGIAGLSAGLDDLMRDIRETGRTLSQIIEVTGASATSPVTALAPVGIPDAPWSNPRRSAGGVIALEDLPVIARTAAAAIGLNEEFIRGLDIFARAGEIPIVVGNSAELLLNCYARVVAAGALTRMPLDPSILGPDDLWQRAGSGAATPMALAWQAAIKDSSKVQIVCLDDVDRASLSEWFARFKSLYRFNRPDNLLLVATLSPGSEEMLNATQRRLHPMIVANVKTDAMAAILTGGGIDEDELRYLSGPTRSSLTATDRRSLLARVAGSGVEGGDAANRLLAIHSSALAWLEPGKAGDFAVNSLLPSKSDIVAVRSDAVAEIHAERKTS